MRADTSLLVIDFNDAFSDSYINFMLDILLLASIASPNWWPFVLPCYQPPITVVIEH